MKPPGIVPSRVLRAGLQCYAIPGDKAEIPAPSMTAWRGYQERIAR
jgi:hypothetical protein